LGAAQADRGRAPRCNGLAQHVLKVPKEKLRVVSPDVGGGLGLRGKLLPDSAMALWAARRPGSCTGPAGIVRVATVSFAKHLP
jgi:hypothetical protein